MFLARLFISAAVLSLTAAPTATLAQTTPDSPPAAASAPPADLPPSPHVVANGNLLTTLQGSGDFTILLNAISATGLGDVLKSQPNITLFAPTDQAFKALPPAELSQLLAAKNAPTLQKILIYHLVNLKLDSSKMKGVKGPVPTVENGNVVIDGSGEVLKVNNADIIQSDVMASNGIIHVIDKVLIPSDVALPAAAASTATPATGG